MPCLGLPSNPPNITSVSPLSDSSFTVNWTISDPNYSYTVIWTNLNTSVVNSFTVSENTNSYTVTGLSDTDSYIVSVTAVNMCGNITSDPITVTGEYVRTYVCMYVCMYVVCMYVYVCMHVCMYVRIYVCMYAVLMIRIKNCPDICFPIVNLLTSPLIMYSKFVWSNLV